MHGAGFGHRLGLAKWRGAGSGGAGPCAAVGRARVGWIELCLEGHGRSGYMARSTRGSGALAACVFDSEEAGRGAGLGEGETSSARRGRGRGTWRSNTLERNEARAAPWTPGAPVRLKKQRGCEDLVRRRSAGAGTGGAGNDEEQADRTWRCSRRAGDTGIRRRPKQKRISEGWSTWAPDLGLM